MTFNNIVAHAQNLITQNYTGAHKPTVVLGLSGGPDSVFLLLILHKLHNDGVLNLVAAHLDHGWRANSCDDARFCSDLAGSLSIPYIGQHASALSLKIKFNGSQEEVGRKLRRHFFEQVCKESDGSFIALAHHQQDQQETFLFRLLRGSSLAGLRCMESIDGLYIRPLLGLSKDVIIHYLETQGISYLIDPTNAHNNYLRNSIRNKVIPAIKSCDSRFDQKFASTLAHLKAEDDFLKKITKQKYESIFDNQNNHNSNHTGTLSLFKKLDRVIQKRIIIDWLIANNAHFSVSNNFVHEIIKFLSSPRGGSHQLSPSWQLNKKQDFFWISQTSRHTSS